MIQFYYILFFIVITVNCESWYGEVKGANKKDGKNGYAGNKGSSITSFYLCGDRHYMVHYLGDKEDIWDIERWNCDPTETSKKIDAISISGGKGYQVRIKNGDWLKMVYGFDINDSNNGYAGILGKEIDAILINGGNIYRVAYGETTINLQSAQKVLKNLFGGSYNLEFDKFNLIYITKRIMVGVKLLHNWEIKNDGLIKFNVKNHKLADIDLGGLIGIDLNSILLSKINLDAIGLKTTLTTGFKDGMADGSISISFSWPEKKIEIDTGTKINSDHSSFRQGFRITITFYDDDDSLGKVKGALGCFENELPSKVKRNVNGLIDQLSSFSSLDDIIPEYNDQGKVSLVLALLFFKEIIENPSIIPI